MSLTLEAPSKSKDCLQGLWVIQKSTKDGSKIAAPSHSIIRVVHQLEYLDARLSKEIHLARSMTHTHKPPYPSLVIGPLAKCADYPGRFASSVLETRTLNLP